MEWDLDNSEARIQIKPPKPNQLTIMRVKSLRYGPMTIHIDQVQAGNFCFSLEYRGEEGYDSGDVYASPNLAEIAARVTVDHLSFDLIVRR